MQRSKVKGIAWKTLTSNKDKDVIACSYREHDWFKIDLPEYLFPPGGDVDASIVDTEAIHEVCEVIGSNSSARVTGLSIKFACLSIWRWQWVFTEVQLHRGGHASCVAKRRPTRSASHRLQPGCGQPPHCRRKFVLLNSLCPFVLLHGIVWLGECSMIYELDLFRLWMCCRVMTGKCFVLSVQLTNYKYAISLWHRARQPNHSWW